jgi:hypothetical protein
MAANELSEVALELIRLHFSGNSLRMGASKPDPLPGHTLEETRAAYGELVADGLMTLVDIDRDAQSSRYWLTLAAMERKSEWLARPSSGSLASPRGSAAPAG